MIVLERCIHGEPRDEGLCLCDHGRGGHGCTTGPKVQLNLVLALPTGMATDYSILAGASETKHYSVYKYQMVQNAF